MADWKDFTVILCLALIIVGTAAMAVAAQTFTLVKGRILQVGIGELAGEDAKIEPTKTITVLIESDDRVFRIDSGTAVTYAISEKDAESVKVGSDVELLVSSYSNRVRILEVKGSPHI